MVQVLLDKLNTDNKLVNSAGRECTLSTSNFSLHKLSNQEPGKLHIYYFTTSSHELY